jgi:hypothetical protein
MTRRFSLRGVVSIAVLTACGLWSSAVRAETATEQALEQSRLTGKPILAVASRETCGLCQALKRRFASEASLRPLLAEFVPLHLDVDEPAWQEWARQFPAEGNTLPFLYVIRADGEKLYAKGGAPQGAELPQMLGGMRQQSGTELSAKQAEKLQAALTTANEAISAGDTAKAVATIVPAAVRGSFAQPAVEATRLLETLTEQGKQAITEAESKLASPDTTIDGAVALVETLRVYKKLPEVFKLANEAKRSHKEAAIKLAFVQAAMIDKGRVFESRTQTAKAIDAYRAVAAKYPDTPAAALVQARIDALEASGNDSAAQEDESN